VAELLVVFRERQGDGSYKHDYQLSNASLTTEVWELARVFKAQHRIESCQADYLSRRRRVYHPRGRYHKRDGVARTGHVVPATLSRTPRRTRMPTPGRAAPPRT
jgi:hypothetical protein